MNIKFCPKCGKEIEQYGLFCNACGSRLPLIKKEENVRDAQPTDQTETLIEDQALQSDEPFIDQHTQEPDDTTDGQEVTPGDPNKKKKNLTFLLSLIGLLLLASAAAIVLFVFPGYLNKGVASQTGNDYKHHNETTESRAESDTYAATAKATEKETETETEPIQNIDISGYIGYWYPSGDSNKQLTVKRVTGDKVYFGYTHLRTIEIDEIIATLYGNQADFEYAGLETQSNTIRGYLEFSNGRINMYVTQSALNDSLPTGSTTYSIQEMSSLFDARTEPEPSGLPYTVHVKVTELNVRSGPGTNHGIVEVNLTPGDYVIVEESPGEGSTAGWGRIEGRGWISLDYAQKLS